MIQSKKVLVAPDVIYSFIDRGHPKHEQASAYIRFFAQEQYSVYIDLPSILSTYTHIYEAMSMSLAKDFVRTMGLSDLNIIYPDESDLKGALKVLTSSQTTELTFQKALLSVVADRRNIPFITTFEYLNPLFGISLFYLPI